MLGAETWSGLVGGCCGPCTLPFELPPLPLPLSRVRTTSEPRLHSEPRGLGASPRYAFNRKPSGLRFARLAMFALPCPVCDILHFFAEVRPQGRPISSLWPTSWTGFCTASSPAALSLMTLAPRLREQNGRSIQQQFGCGSKIKQEGQTAGFGLCFHLPGQLILVPVF